MAENGIININPEAKEGSICHRFFIPMAYANQTPKGQVPGGMLFNTNCLKEKCAIWNSDKQACADLVGTKAEIALVDHFEREAGKTKIDMAGV